MARTVNEQENAERRSRILDAASRLIYAKGYESMSVQDVLDAAGISKGAFYHYFDSKQDLLEAFVGRLTDDALRRIAPIVDDPTLPALAKFQRVMADGLAWKTERKAMLASLMRAWYGEDNLRVRLRLNEAGRRAMAPLVGRIVRQGVAEGVFDAPDPERAADLFLVLGVSLTEGIVAEMLADPPAPGALARILALADAYARIYERILGAPAGSVRLLDPDLMERWLAG